MNIDKIFLYKEARYYMNKWAIEVLDYLLRIRGIFKWVWTKYFENELEMNKYKNKIRFVKNLLIEDSRAIEWRIINEKIR